MDTGNETTGLWVRWIVGATVSLIAVVFAVFWLQMNSALLLGWALGMILAATLNLFWRARG